MDPNERYLAIINRTHEPAITERLAFVSAGELEVSGVEARLGIRLPELYTRLLADVGTFSSAGDVSIENPSRFGRLFRRELPSHSHEHLLTATLSGEDSIVAATERERLARPPLPAYLVPFSIQTYRCGRRVFRVLICFDFNRLQDGEPLVTRWYPWPGDGPIEAHRDDTFLDWLDQELCLPCGTEESSWVDPPEDWDDTAGWDTYWQHTIADRFRQQWEATQTSHLVFGELDWLREHGVHRILLAGNGISLEGHALSHVGFDVTALDVSPTASEFVAGFPVEPRHLARFLPDFDRVHESSGRTVITELRYSEEKSLARVEREARPGGCLRVVTADMFAYAPEEPYDLVVSNRSIQGFTPERRSLLARRMWTWVRPGGFCIVETMNLCMGGHHVLIEKEFETAGFFERTWPREARDIKRDRKHRRKRLIQEALEAEAARLAAGEKMVMFAHNSG